MEENSLLRRLDGIESRFEEVSTLISDPSVISDMKRYVKLNKEYHDLERLTAATRRYRSLLANISEAREALDTETDSEMRQMAKEQLDEASGLLPEVEQEIKLLLIPADPEDSKNAIVEIRGGTGGDEAALFAGDLFKMYQRYCEKQGWNVAVTSFSEGAAGGFKEIVFSVSGQNVYGILKYESGVHRVQRVPSTETQGACAHLGCHGSRSARSRSFRCGNQRGRNQVGNFPLGRCRRPECKQGRVGRASALHVAQSGDRPDRRDSHRMHRNPRPAQKQRAGVEPSAHIYI